MRVALVASVVVAAAGPASASAPGLRGHDVASSTSRYMEVDYDGIAEGQEPEEIRQYDNGVNLIEMQMKPDVHADESKEGLVLSGVVHLSDIYIPPTALENGGGADYSGVTATFCDYDWGVQKLDPSAVSKFRDITSLSDHCSDHMYKFNLAELIVSVRAADAQDDSKVRASEPAGFVFQEPDSGSEVITSAIISANPVKTRVVSEHPALTKVLNFCDTAKAVHKKEACSRQKQKTLVRDVIYLLTRTTDELEDQIYFKPTPAATVNMDIITEMYPEGRWIFTKKNHDGILTNQMTGKQCRKNKNKPSQALLSFIEANGAELQGLTDTEVCAAYLASLDEVAANQQALTGTGRIVEVDTELNETQDIVDVLNTLGIRVGSNRKLFLEEQMEKHAEHRRHFSEEVRPEISAANARFPSPAMEAYKASKVSK